MLIILKVISLRQNSLSPLDMNTYSHLLDTIICISCRQLNFNMYRLESTPSQNVTLLLLPTCINGSTFNLVSQEIWESSLIPVFLSIHVIYISEIYLFLIYNGYICTCIHIYMCVYTYFLVSYIYIMKFTKLSFSWFPPTIFISGLIFHYSLPFSLLTIRIFSVLHSP